MLPEASPDLPGPLPDPTVGDAPPARVPRHWSVSSLGASLAVLLAVTWVTAVPYLLVLAGLRTPVRLAIADAAHLVSGVVLVVFLLAKVRRVGGRAAVAGVGEALLWQRWVSAGVGFLLGAVVVTGALALCPLSAPVRSAFGQAHLLLAIWATAPALWHVIHHRRRARRHLKLSVSGGALGRRRWWAGVALAVAPVLLVSALLPRALSPLAEDSADAAWQPAGVSGFLDAAVTVATPAGGRTLLVGGSGLFAATQPGRSAAAVAGRGGPPPGPWRRVGPFGPTDVVLALGSAGAGSGTGLDTGIGLGASPRIGAVLVGAGDGLYRADEPTGPYVRLVALPDVHAAAVAPLGSALWCSSAQGMWRSIDGGRSWTREDVGLEEPVTAWALAFDGATLFGSDARAVYRWDRSRWVRTSPEFNVVTLDPMPGGALEASSMGDGVYRWHRGSWDDTSAGLTFHDHGPVHGIHMVSVTEIRPGLDIAGSMLGGAEVSLDGGDTWSPVWPQLGADGVVWRVVPFGREMFAVTDSGLFSAPVSHPAGAAWWWWLAVPGAGLASGVVAAVVGSARRRRRGPAGDQRGKVPSVAPPAVAEGAHGGGR